MSNEGEQTARLNSYKKLFNQKLITTMEQYNEELLELCKKNISSIIKKIQKEYEPKQTNNSLGYSSSSDSDVDTDSLPFMNFLNKKMSDEINYMSLKLNAKYKRDVKNTLDSELTTFLNKSLFMIFDIKRKQEQITEMMISNLINQSPSLNEDDDGDDDDDDDDDANDEDVRRRNNEAPSPALPCPLKPHASTSSDS